MIIRRMNWYIYLVLVFLLFYYEIKINSICFGFDKYVYCDGSYMVYG